MTSLNIGGDKSDSSYRYKMPSLVTKIEGRGNGIKTVILNMTEVAKALHIHPAYPTKFFGIELGAQSKFNALSDRAIVNGAHNPGVLAAILEKFIHNLILCPKCKLPELNMSVKSTIKIDCRACGYNDTIKSTNKLTQYIIKNPPKQLADEELKDRNKNAKVRASVDLPEDLPKAVGELDLNGGAGEQKDAKGEKKKKGKKEHKGGKKKKDKTEEDGEAAEEEETDVATDELPEEEEEVEEKPKKTKEKEKKEKKPKGEKEKPSKSKNNDNADAPPAKGKKSAKKDSDDEWETDTSEEAQAARREAEFKESRDASAARIDSILSLAKNENKGESPVTTMKIFLAAHSRTNQEIVAELKRISLAKGLDQTGKLKVLLESVVEPSEIKDGKAFEKQISPYFPIFLQFTSDRPSSLQFIACIEELVGVTYRILLPLTGHILKCFYENDVVEEEVIIAWFDSPPEASWLVKKEVAEAVRAKAKVFVTWLKEAEDEEEEEEGEEEEEEA